MTGGPSQRVWDDMSEELKAKVQDVVYAFLLKERPDGPMQEDFYKRVRSEREMWNAIVASTTAGARSGARRFTNHVQQGRSPEGVFVVMSPDPRCTNELTPYFLGTNMIARLEKIILLAAYGGPVKRQLNTIDEASGTVVCCHQGSLDELLTEIRTRIENWLLFMKTGKVKDAQYWTRGETPRCSLETVTMWLLLELKKLSDEELKEVLEDGIEDA